MPSIEAGMYKRRHKKFIPEFSHIHNIDNDSEPTKRLLEFVAEQRKKSKKNNGGK